MGCAAAHAPDDGVDPGESGANRACVTENSGMLGGWVVGGWWVGGGWVTDFLAMVACGSGRGGSVGC